MITVISKGNYKLIETRGHVKILTLDQKAYAWILTEKVGEMLVTTHKPHVTDRVLSSGAYRLYLVEDEPDFVDEMHLELNVGPRIWQGYLLPTGLPTDTKIRSKIIPTHEVLSQRRTKILQV